ncbi:MAG: nucleotidyltransferase domain-containing protein [Syntrophomonas sp.]
MGISIEQQNFVDKTVDILKQDDRIVGIAIGGSYLTGTMDEYSDLDFVIVVKPEDELQVSNERIQVAGKLGNLLSAFTGEHVGEPRLLICLYDSPLLHVDLKFVSLNDVGKRVEDPFILYQKDNALTDAFSRESAFFPTPDLQWIEDRFWVWVHYGATKIGRKEMFETIEFISFLRQTVIAPLILIKKGKLPRGVRNIENDAPEYLPLLLDTVAGHDVKSCVKALRTIIDLYKDLRQFHGTDTITLRHQAERRALEYFNSIN